MVRSMISVDDTLEGVSTTSASKYTLTGVEGRVDWGGAGCGWRPWGVERGDGAAHVVGATEQQPRGAGQAGAPVSTGARACVRAGQASTAVQTAGKGHARAMPWLSSAMQSTGTAGLCATRPLHNMHNARGRQPPWHVQMQGRMWHAACSVLCAAAASLPVDAAVESTTVGPGARLPPPHEEVAPHSSSNAPSPHAEAQDEGGRHPGLGSAVAIGRLFPRPRRRRARRGHPLRRGLLPLWAVVVPLALLRLLRRAAGVLGLPPGVRPWLLRHLCLAAIVGGVRHHPQRPGPPPCGPARRPPEQRAAGSPVQVGPVLKQRRHPLRRCASAPPRSPLGCLRAVCAGLRAHVLLGGCVPVAWCSARTCRRDKLRRLGGGV